MLTRRCLLTSAAAISVAGYLPYGARAATPDGIAVMAKAIDDVVGGFDPAEAYEATSVEVCVNVYRMLVTIDPSDSGKFVGDLADSWEVSADGATTTFKLREGVTFESGRPVTAEDVVFSFHRLMKLGKAPSSDVVQFGITADNVESMVRVGEKNNTVIITIPTPRSPELLLATLTTPAGCVVEKALAMANEVNGDFGNAWLRTNSAGSGPYLLASWRASESIILMENPNAEKKPAIPRLVIRHVADSPTQVLLVQKGDVDIARDIGSDELVSARKNEELEIDNAPSLTVMYMGMNMGQGDLQKPQVRQAIKWAIDYEAIAKNITPETWSAWQSFEPQGVPGATAGPFKKDVDKAKALLAEANLANGLTITLDHIAKKPFSDIAQAIQANLAEVGISVELLAGEASQVFGKMRARQHQLIISYWSPNYPDPDYNAQSFCINRNDSDHTSLKSLAWRQHFEDAEIISLADAAATEANAEKRLDMYRQIQTVFFERAPFAILLQQAQVTVLRKGVTGLSIGALPNYTRFSGIAKS